MNKRILYSIPWLVVILLAGYFVSANSANWQKSWPLYNCLLGSVETTLDPRFVEYETLGTFPEKAEELEYFSLFYDFPDTDPITLKDEQDPYTVGFKYKDTEDGEFKYAYIKDRQMFGPFTVRPEFADESWKYTIHRAEDGFDDVHLSYYLEDGWPETMKPLLSEKEVRKLEQNGNSLNWVGAGGTFTFDTGSYKQSKIFYNNDLVAHHAADCDFYEPVHEVFLSESGERYAYLFRLNKKLYLNVDGKTMEFKDLYWGDEYGPNPQFAGEDFIYYEIDNQNHDIVMVKIKPFK